MVEIVRSGDVEFDVQSPITLKDGSVLYSVGENQIAKIFTKKQIEKYGKELETKLRYPEVVPGVILPNSIIYTSEGMIGYTMNHYKGGNDKRVESSLDYSYRMNLFRLADKYKRLETLVKNASDDVVFPFLLDRSNMVYDNKGKLYVTNYDRVQIGSHKSFGRTRVLGELVESEEKYYDPEKELYTKNLDIRSLYQYYLKVAFDINLGDIIHGVDFCKEMCDLEDKLNEIGLPDYIKRKIYDLFLTNTPNEYLGDDVWKLAEEYELVRSGTDSSLKLTLEKRN